MLAREMNYLFPDFYLVKFETIPFPFLQIGELAGLAVGMTIILNVLVAG